jgi:hypothetical protein
MIATRFYAFVTVGDSQFYVSIKKDGYAICTNTEEKTRKMTHGLVKKARVISAEDCRSLRYGLI